MAILTKMYQWILIVTAVLFMLSGCDNSHVERDNSVELIHSIAVTPTSSALPKGTQQQLQAQALVYGAGQFSLRPLAQFSAVTWESSDPSIASVNQSGHVTALNEGQARIKVSLLTSFGQTIVAYADIEVTDALIVDVWLTPFSTSLARGFSQDLRAYARYTDDSVLDISATDFLTWSSSAHEVVSVNQRSH